MKQNKQKKKKHEKHTYHKNTKLEIIYKQKASKKKKRMSK